MLQRLEAVAVLMRGVWVLKSDICCGGSQRLALCRDFVLMYLRAHGEIDRGLVLQLWRRAVTTQQLKGILGRICTPLDSNGAPAPGHNNARRWKIKARVREQSELEVYGAGMDQDALIGGEGIMRAAAAAAAGLGKTTKGREMSDKIAKLFSTAGKDSVPSWLVKRHPGLVQRQRRWWLDRASLLALSIAEGGALVSRGGPAKVKREIVRVKEEKAGAGGAGKASSAKGAAKKKKEGGGKKKRRKKK